RAFSTTRKLGPDRAYAETNQTHKSSKSKTSSQDKKMKNNVPTKTEDKNKEKVMNQNTKHSCSSRRLPMRITLAALAVLASISVARASEDNRAPDLPSPLCDRLGEVQGGRVAFHVYA